MRRYDNIFPLFLNEKSLSQRRAPLRKHISIIFERKISVVTACAVTTKAFSELRRNGGRRYRNKVFENAGFIRQYSEGMDEVELELPLLAN